MKVLNYRKSACYNIPHIQLLWLCITKDNGCYFIKNDGKNFTVIFFFLRIDYYGNLLYTDY